MAGTFKFELVSPEKVLLSVDAEQVELPGGDYLFFTSQGILRLPTAFLHDYHEALGSVEVHDDRNNPKATRVAPVRFTTDPILQKEVWKKGYWDKKGNLWLCSDHRLLQLKKRDLRKAVG